MKAKKFTCVKKLEGFSIGKEYVLSLERDDEHGSFYTAVNDKKNTVRIRQTHPWFSIGKNAVKEIPRGMSKIVVTTGFQPNEKKDEKFND
jgi:hypothetical protein